MENTELLRLTKLISSPLYKQGEKAAFVLGYANCLKHHGVEIDFTSLYSLILKINGLLKSGSITEESTNLIYAQALSGSMAQALQFIDTMHVSAMHISFQPVESPPKKQQEIDSKSKELIQKLMEEERQPIIPQEEEPAKCGICLDLIKPKEYFPLDSCGHLFHRECIKKHINFKIAERKFPILCPDVECLIELSFLDMKDFLSKEDLAKYDELGFKKLIEENPDEYSCCPSPGCNFAFSYKKGVDSSKFQCPVCKIEYCLDCHCVYHKEMSCAAYQKDITFSKQDALFYQFVRGQKFKQCPKCKFWISKTTGCDHMSCRCGMSFCYRCGNGFPCKCVVVKKAAAKKKRYYYK